MTSRTDSVTVDSGTFDLHVWVPESGSGPGILLIQEIFGVGPYIKAVAERLVKLGYVVGAPDVFWRITRNWEADHSPEGLQSSIGLMPKFDFPAGIGDCISALHRLEELPEVTGTPGVMGFCLGGGLGWFVAANAEPRAAVLYYGSAIASGTDLVGKITCPTLMHWGAQDAYIPTETLDKIEAAVEGHGHITSRVWDAGHAFDNHEAPMFWNEAAARAAWSETTAFLAQHLG